MCHNFFCIHLRNHTKKETQNSCYAQIAPKYINHVGTNLYFPNKCYRKTNSTKQYKHSSTVFDIWQMKITGKTNWFS